MTDDGKLEFGGGGDTKHGETERLWSGSRQAAKRKKANGFTTGVKENSALTYFRLGLHLEAAGQ